MADLTEDQKQAFIDAMNALGEWFDQVSHLAIETINMIKRPFYDMYLQEGAIFGESDRGFSMWLLYITRGKIRG